jgi:triphosphoribosyl-dephospho-CoA synthetase
VNDLKETGMSNLEKARIGAGLSRAELAKEMGVSYATIRKWEIGEREPSCQMLKRQRLDRFKVTEGVKAITRGIVERDLLGLSRSKAGPGHLSHGERIYMTHGLTGARGEAELGFPTVVGHGLPALEKALKCGLSLNDAMVHSLISIMAYLDDTCVVHRSSLETLEQEVKPRARMALAKGGMFTGDGRKSILLMDKEFVSLGISPGGSGDLLGVTLALHFLPYLELPFLTREAGTSSG